MTIKSIRKLSVPIVSDTGTDMFGADISSQPGMKKRSYTIDVNSHMQFQQIRGIGGTFSEQMAECYLHMSPENQEKLLVALFEDKFDFCRMPIGANDFALEWYSLNEKINDFAMNNFSIERDQKYLIPLIRAAQNINDKIALHASPWSPPSWMKDNGEYASGAIIESEENFKAYALYLRLFLEAYDSEEIPIERLIVQNEPDVNTIYPSCHFMPKAMSTFIIDYLSPELRETDLKAKLYAGAFRCIRSNVAINFLSEREEITEHIDGIAMQYTMSQPLVDIHHRYGDALGLMHTESNCFNGENDWEQAIYLYHNVIDMLAAGTDNFSYWNMVLDEKGASTWGWTQNSLITYNKQTDELSFNPDFYVMDLLGKVIKPGMRRTSYHSLTNKGISFVDEVGNSTIIIANFTAEPAERGLLVDGVLNEITLEPQTIEVFYVEA